MADLLACTATPVLWSGNHLSRLWMQRRSRLHRRRMSRLWKQRLSRLRGRCLSLRWRWRSDLEASLQELQRRCRLHSLDCRLVRLDQAASEVQPEEALLQRPRGEEPSGNFFDSGEECDGVSPGLCYRLDSCLLALNGAKLFARQVSLAVANASDFCVSGAWQRNNARSSGHSARWSSCSACASVALA